MSIVLSNPDQIALYRLATLRSMLRLEIKGLKRSRGPSAYSILKNEYGLRGTRQQVLDEVVSLLQNVHVHEDHTTH